MRRDDEHVPLMTHGEAYADGVKAERERIATLIEGMDGPREGRSLDFGDVITSNNFDDWVDSLLAAIKEDHRA